MVGMNRTHSNRIMTPNPNIGNIENEEDYLPQTDPKKFGPGMWLSIHQDAVIADKVVRPEVFTIPLSYKASQFPCEKCKEHFLKYLLNNDPAAYKRVNPSETHPMAKWSFNFHNAVNGRLGKPLMTWSTFLSMYVYDNSSSVCTAGCGQ